MKEFLTDRITISDEDAFSIEIDRKFPLQIHDIPYIVSKSNITNLKNHSDITKDFGEWDKGSIDLEALAEKCNSLATEDSNIIVFFNNWMEFSSLCKAFNNRGFDVDCLVWEKTNPMPQIRKRHFLASTELIMWAHRGKYTFNFKTQNEMHSLIRTPICMGKERLKDEEGHSLHPTQKPLSVIRYFIEILSNPDDEVLDLFAGTMTTGSAAIQLGRKTWCNEREKDYYNAGKKRLLNG